MKAGERKNAYERERLAGERAAAIERLGGRCEICGTQRLLTVDLIEPREKYHSRSGGGSRPKRWREESGSGNAQVLCARCNAVKQRRGREWRAPFPRMAYTRWHVARDKRELERKRRWMRLGRAGERVLAARAACEETHGRAENN